MYQTENSVHKFFAHYDLFGVKVYLSNDDKKDENSGYITKSRLFLLIMICFLLLYTKNKIAEIC